MHFQPHSGIILFAKGFMLNARQWSEYAFFSITAQQFARWPDAMCCIRYIQNSGIFTTIYSVIFRHIQAYSALLKHMQAYWEIFTNIKAYSEPCVTLAFAEIWHNRNCTLMHIQTPVILTKIGEPCLTLEIQNSGILIILEYSKPWHI